MSGLLDKATSASDIMGQVQSKVDQLKATTMDPSLIAQLDAISLNITNGSSSMMGSANSASSSITGMFSLNQAATTTGLNMVLQCVCQGAAGELSKDFMKGMGELYQGAGIDKVVDQAQSALDFVNGISSVTAETVNQIAAQADEMIQKGVDTLGEVASAVDDAVGITSTAKKAAAAMGFMGTVLGSCVPKADLFDVPSVKDMLSADPLISLSLDIGLNTDNMQEAACQMLGQSGLMDQATSLQDSLNAKLDNLRG